MSADDDDLKERCRRAIAFLQRARELPEVSPAQIDRIERRLHQPPPVRRPLLSPALAALVVLLLAGGAVAMVGRDLTWLPGVGRWLGTRHEPSRVPAPHTGAHAPRLEAPGAAPAAATPQSAPAPSPATLPAPINVAPAPPEPLARAIDRPVGAAETNRAHETRVALVPKHHAPPRGETAEAQMAVPASSGEPKPEPASGPIRAQTAFAPAPPASGQPTRPATTPAPAPTPAVAVTAERPTTAAPPSRTIPSPIVAESRSFASALELWHHDHDAAAALTALDAHERRFPSGQILLEARLLRTEILLASGRDADALALLDPLSLAGLPRARELRTVRGELRIKLGRCTDGKADLLAVLATSTADPLAQRARHGIAACP